MADTGLNLKNGNGTSIELDASNNIQINADIIGQAGSNHIIEYGTDLSQASAVCQIFIKI